MCNYISLKLPRNFPEFFYRLVRGSLYAFTFILCILGISFIIFAFWYIYEGKNYHLDNSIKFGVFSISFIIGSILFGLASCGLVGVLNERVVLAKIFLFGSLFLMLFELACIFFIYAYKKEVLTHASTLFQRFISQYSDDDDVRLLVDTIQSELKCCGISSPHDWERNLYYSCSSISSLACSVPASCCYHYPMNEQKEEKFNMFCGVGVRRNESLSHLYQLIYVTGCKYSIYAFLDYKHKLTATVLIGVLVPQLIGVILIVSFIILLNYLIDFDSIDTSKYMIPFKRNPFFDFEIPVVDVNDNKDLFLNKEKKHLYLLAIGPNNDFLKKSPRLKTSFDNDAIDLKDEVSDEKKDRLEIKHVPTDVQNKTDENSTVGMARFMNYNQYIESAPPFSDI